MIFSCCRLSGLSASASPNRAVSWAAAHRAALIGASRVPRPIRFSPDNRVAFLRRMRPINGSPCGRLTEEFNPGRGGNKEARKTKEYTIQLQVRVTETAAQRAPCRPQLSDLYLVSSAFLSFLVSCSEISHHS